MGQSFIKAGLFIFWVSCMLVVNAQADSNRTEELVKKQQFTFKAQVALPMKGGFMQLTPGYYDVVITKDSIISFLPYFGRAYSPPVSPSDAGIKFVSTNFTYTATVNKKGNWQITIQPKDVTDIQQVNLNISSGGQAFLQVTSINRQAISFNGLIEKSAR
jgi:hypothetical protein